MSLPKESNCGLELTLVVEHSSGPSVARYNPNGGIAGPDISKVEYEGYESDDSEAEAGGQEVVTAVSSLMPKCGWMS